MVCGSNCVFAVCPGDVKCLFSVDLFFFRIGKCTLSRRDERRAAAAGAEEPPEIHKEIPPQIN